MKWLTYLMVLAPTAAASLLFAAPVSEKAPPTFDPFEQWKAAVVAGDQSALGGFYTTRPPARILVSKQPGTVANEIQFWSNLKTSGVTHFNPKILSIEANDNQAQLIMRVQATQGSQNLVASLAQIWVRQLDGWHIVVSQRGDFHVDAGRRLPEPAKPNAALYADPSQAQQDLKRALAQAARERKRVLVVFGANWCYDCHVLDATFRSPSFAPLMRANYVVLHISIGDEGKDNNDLAARMGVNLDHGVPSLAVLDPDGKVVVAQQNGEFESTVKIGPEDVRAFLEKWKPARG